MRRTATFSAALAGGALFALLISLGRLVEVLQPIVVAISIMAAGLLVRLNRGMPTLDWNSLEPIKRKLLTQKVVELTREYLYVLALQFAALLSLIALAVVTKEPSLISTDPWVQRGTAGAVGVLITLCITRMGYIVWRDHDIVCLQKLLIDESADKDATEEASKSALGKVAAIRAAGLRGTAAIDAKPRAE